MNQKKNSSDNSSKPRGGTEAVRRQETWLHEENNERSSRGERQSQSGLWGKVDSWFEEAGVTAGMKRLEYSKIKGRKITGGQRQVFGHIRRMVMSVKHAPRAVFVFFMMCVCVPV